MALFITKQGDVGALKEGRLHLLKMKHQVSVGVTYKFSRAFDMVYHIKQIEPRVLVQVLHKSASYNMRALDSSGETMTEVDTVNAFFSKNEPFGEKNVMFCDLLMV